MSNSSPPRVALVETENSIVYNSESFEDFSQEGNYRLYDILWSDGRASQHIRSVSDGVVPIGLCVIPTNWLDEGEKARFVSLKYMSSQSPEIGGLEREDLCCGMTFENIEVGSTKNPGTSTMEPTTDNETKSDDPMFKHYRPYACKNENSYLLNDVNSAHYYWDSSSTQLFNDHFTDIRNREDWLYVLNYCKQNLNKYAICDINGKQNTLDSLVEINYNDECDVKYYIVKFAPNGTNAGDWYIPAVGELLQFTFRLRSDQNSPSINDKVDEISRIYPQDCVTKFNDNGLYWSFTPRDGQIMYTLGVNNEFASISGDSRHTPYSPFVAFLQR